jgi:hypothetical protein
MKGDETTFVKWQSENKEKWDAFIKWFTPNYLVLDDEHQFYTSQYK